MWCSLQDLPECWNSTKKLCLRVKKSVAPLQANEAKIIRRKCQQFEILQHAFQEKFWGRSPFFLHPDHFMSLHKQQASIAALEREMAALSESAGLFQVSVPEYKQLKAWHREVRLLKELWDMINLVNMTIDGWKTTKWKDINVEQMDRDCKTFAKKIQSLDKEMRSWDAFTGLDSSVKNILTSLRAVKELQHPAIRDQHWQEIMEATKLTPRAFTKKSPTARQRLADSQELKLPAITQQRGPSETSHHKLTPSAFMKEMSLTTKQRMAATQEMKLPPITQLRDMSETSFFKFSTVDLGRSLFQPVSSEIVFQSYVPYEVYEMPLVLRNIDKVPRRVKVVMEKSLYFKLVVPSGVCRKVAPGMTTSFRVLFTPEENKDYFHQLTCITERETFNVPIRAIGARAILDFPDELNFSSCPVKYTTQKTLLIHNVGNRVAHYCLSTESPFYVSPSIGTLGTGESMQVTVEFHPLKTGDHSKSLLVHYDTGEDIHTNLCGVAVDVDIGLEKSSLRVDNTYVTLTNRSSVVLHNRSEITAHFQWKTFATQEKEDQEKLRLCHKLQTRNDNMSYFYMDDIEDAVLQEQLPLLSHAFKSKKAKLLRGPMLFSDDVFSIEPMEGDVLPNSLIEINVTFKPQEATFYQKMAYCDISGRETRLPLFIEAEGIESQLRLNLEELDMGEVFLGSTHSYEVILFNKGAIHAFFTLPHPSTTVASCFSFDPKEGTIPPNGLQAITISFSPTFLGKFKRRLKFKIKGSPEFVTLTARGCVIAPTCHFNVPSLDFGIVSFGFPRTLSCCLTNTSSVPITVKLRIPGDGLGEPSVASTVLMLDNTQSSQRRGGQGHRIPMEFTITPCRGTILPHGSLDIQVAFCSNTVKRYHLVLLVDVEGVAKNVLSLPLSARCIVPPLRVLNPFMMFGQCFLKVPYEQTLTLMNDGDLPGCFRVLPQEHKATAAVQYSSPVTCGIIQPHGLVDIPFTVEAQVIGEQTTVLQVAACGREAFPLEVHLVCIGEGAVVYVHPNKINFGKIQVLQDISQPLYLSNQTPTPASFRAEMVGKPSRWRIEPSKGVIPPNTELSVAVIVNLDDNKTFKDEVKLFIENSRSYIIPVQATGIGSTIVTDEPIPPQLILGPQFSLTPVRYRFHVTNKGRRTHLLYWKMEGTSAYHQRHRLPALSSTKDKHSSQNSKSACPAFKLRPLRMELMPGKSMEVVLECFSRTPQVVKERLLCHAVVGSKAGKVEIMQVDVACEFVTPVLQVSPREVTFQVMKQPSDVLTLQYQPLSLKNLTPLPLSTVLAVEQPFSIRDANQQPLPADVPHVKLEAGEELHLTIGFNPAYEEDLKIREVEKALKIQFLEHPHEEQVTVRGEVFFPNLHIPTTAVDFGCILNNTEDVRYVKMTNCSPLPVRYHWVFITDSLESQVRFSPPVSQNFINPQLSEEESAQSECPVSAESSSEERSVEERAKGLETAENPLLTMEDEDDSLDAKLVFGTCRRHPCLICGWACLICTQVLSQLLLARGGDGACSRAASRRSTSCLLQPTMLVFQAPSPALAVEAEGAAETQNLMRIEECLKSVGLEPFNVGIEKVFDILPRFCVLQPSESQWVTFTFFGHANIVASVLALCRVEGGPTYEVSLSGEASLINYHLNTTEIHYGLQLFNKVVESEVTLRNSGKAGFTYEVLNPSVATADCPQPREPLVLPSTGFLGPGKEQVMKIYYLPGVPGDFCRTFRVQMGHLEPEEITLNGEGRFPRFSLDLPRNIKGNEKYEKVYQEAKEKVEQDSQRDKAVVLGEAVAAEPPTDGSDTKLETQIQMQMEEMLVEEHALEQMEALASSPPEDSVFDHQARCRLVEVELPEYILDLGYVILSSVHTHTVTVTNTGQFPMSFRTDGRVLRGTGFIVQPNHIKDLPCCETKTLEVRFDPESANLPLGQVDTLLPIKVEGGPTFHIRLRANVSLPSLCLSKDSLVFSAVQCGQCKEETIQFHNHLQVPCKWFLTISGPVKKVDKNMQGRARQKLLREVKKRKPHVFTALPSSGALSPGQRCNVRIRFSPTEEKFYKSILKIDICQSSQHLQLPVSGHGLEPQLEFCPPVLELGPLLPNSQGVEGTVMVKNPCEFPIEFYSLEFDHQYLEEEQILRMLKDYNSQNTLLLPPRAPGDKLPQELLEYYEDQKRLQDEQSKSESGKPEGQANGKSEGTQSLSNKGRKLAICTISLRSSVAAPFIFVENQSSKVDCKLECGDEEEKGIEKRHNTAEHEESAASSKEAAEEENDSPVYRAIARHLGIDISAEGRAAQNLRGIVIIIHGAPLTGKTSAATYLSKYYGAACLSIDSIVTEAIANSTSLAGLRARDLCMAAACEQSSKDTEDTGKETDISSRRKLSVDRRHSPHRPQSGFRRKDSLRSIGSRVWVSTAGGKRRERGHTSQSQKQHKIDTAGSQPVLSFICAPTPRRLSICSSTAGEKGFMSCVLPEDLLVDILSERLQRSDCYQGVVFDSLDTLFAHSMASALLCLLRALKNRRHIYFVDLSQDYTSWKTKELEVKEQKERELEEAARREKERLSQVNEEEYEALTEEEKTLLNKYIREAQRARKMREMKELDQELEERQLKGSEKESRSSSKKGKKQPGKDKDTALRSKSQPREKQNSSASITTMFTSIQPSVNKGAEKKDSTASVREVRKQQSKVSLKSTSSAVEEPADPESGETEGEALSDSEKNLAVKFKMYEASQKDVAHILSFWDRAQGILLSPLSHKEKHLRRLSISKNMEDRKKCNKKKHPEEESVENLKAVEESTLSVLEEEPAEESSRGQAVRVPCLEVQVLKTEDVIKEILGSGKLPPVEQILDELGLGPSGPPIPSSTLYSVVHYPEERVAPAADPLERFYLVDPEDATAEDKKKSASSHLHGPALLTVKKSESLVPSTRGREKAAHGRKTSKGKRSSSRGRRGHRVGSRSSSKENLSNVERAPTPQRPARLSHCRWIVPAHGKVELKIFFNSTELGQFEQMLHFETVGTRRQYQLQCRGTCLYPTISQDPRVVFPQCRKSKKVGDVIFKQYVMDTGVFHFGPLFCGKSKDWHEVEHCPNYCEKITILNVSSWEEEVRFSFDRDHQMETFHLDPPIMKLKPNEKQELSIWAHPTSAGLVEDNLICTIKENPEPVVFRLCCQGTLAELEVRPRKVLNFSKLLLHRVERKSLALKNRTPLPMAWCISGLENLGFFLSQRTGIIGPHAEVSVDLYFKATDVVRFKKTFQIEVSDAENLLGTLYTEKIRVLVDVYEVSLDITLPKGQWMPPKQGTGSDSLDFGTRKVLDEKEQVVLSLVNKGRNDIGYRFKLETLDTNISLATHFTVQPEEGILTAYRKPVQVQLIFHPKTPVNIMDKPILQCQVFDPDVSESGEIITTIPVKVSARAVFSKYSISPASFISFGVMLKGTRKTRTFAIQNKGIVAFKFSIQAQSKPSAHQLKSNAPKNEDSNTKRKTSLKQDLAYVTLGMFTVHPGYGSIPPGGHQTITVECHAVSLGKHQEHLSIDIQDRDPMDNPLGIPYTLLAESCIPGFVVDDIESIFEEHQICSSINLYQILQTPRDKGVFIKDENRFLFTNVLVGQQATARFKICNVNKVPCDVALAVKPVSAQCKREIPGVFKVDPVQMRVPSCSHTFGTVTFTPRTVQNYQCTFEASIDTKTSSEANEAHSLTFSISGAGNLPQLTVLHPILRDKKGNPLLLFKKLLLGHSKELPLVLHNGGIVAIKLMMDLIHEGGAFFLKTRPGTRYVYGVTDVYEDSSRDEKKLHTASLVLLPGETAEFDVLFKPTLAQLEEGKIHLTVAGFHHQDLDIQLVGDCYEDDLVLENVHGLVEESEDEGSLSNDDIIEAVREDHIHFGECHVGMPYSVTFTITNRSRADDMQFEWLQEAPFRFSPEVGDLPAGSSKDITLTLESDVPVTFKRHPLKCWVTRIIAPLPPEQVTDRDERLYTVKGIDDMRDPSDARLDEEKVMETDSERAHSVQVEISREVELFLSAVVDYANFKLDRHKIEFKETLLFQTKMFNFQLTNTGDVTLEYTWVVAEKAGKARAHEELPPSTDGHCLSQVKHAPEPTSSSQTLSLNTTNATQPFSVEPSSGTIPAGKEQLFQMKFSPVHVGVFKSVMSCRIPNLIPNLKGPKVTVKGRGLMPSYHFELEDSDYLTSKRHKLESKGRKHARLDPKTRVVEFVTVGVCSSNIKTFMVLNPTSSTYSFQWTCHDPEDPLKQKAFFCLTERGQIEPGEKAEMQFEFVPQHLDFTESSWVFTIPEQNVSVPFLLVGNATDPVVALDRPYINFHSLLIGHKVQKTVYMINKEKEAFSFAFRKSSPFSEGCKVKIEPLKGSIAPLSRLPITVVLTPKQEGQLVFNIKCDVNKKSQSLSLNIKATVCSKVERQRAAAHAAEKQGREARHELAVCAHSPETNRVLGGIKSSVASRSREGILPLCSSLFSTVDLGQSLFQPVSSEIVFQSYVPYEVYEMPLVLRNIDKDYFHQLTCITERETFNVPVRAIGARAILDFPDELNFSSCPVKYTTQKTLLIRNVGNRVAHYCLSPESPFSVSPSIGTLGTGESMQVTVEFHPLKTGDHSKSLLVHYDTAQDSIGFLGCERTLLAHVELLLDQNSEQSLPRSRHGQT
ncbi:LOW QUALITY PROTEIN: hydrocephalus-inducing protein homolog [Phaenicophaeus curvirostris]|uniref:LOW QUALITY PROTEIN: hydrocephalus-inducing protein homolog n=1 Tax=Phaenicophaeus curvirostris TaxID=33595 RepID=UPI0037F0C1D3